MVSTKGSAVCAAANPASPKRANTPASRADAIATGMRFITRSNQPVAPATVISTAQAMKAPTACAIVKPPPVLAAAPASPALASTAAPGVLQATITGFLSHSDGTRVHTPMPMPSAHIHEAMMSGVAPKACAA